MSVVFANYNSGYRIVSLALDECTKDKLMEDELTLMFAEENADILYLLPEQIVLSRDADVIKHIKEYNNYDVFEILDTGVLVRKYNDESDDNYIFITGKCNSNCIMCPSSEYSRRTSQPANLQELLELVKHIPTDIQHLTVTGGEPFLMGSEIFILLSYLKERFVDTEILFLTNGRIFSIDKYVRLFCETSPTNSIVAIPIHGSCPQIHDAITRSNGSFLQTTLGIKHLLKNHIPVEIRLVVSKLNVYDFDCIADLIIKQLNGVEYISVIAMEMTGAARQNKEQVWITYKESFSYISNALLRLVRNGVDVKLYNFPLCTVDPSFWTLCEKSISTDKVRFAENCEQCKYKNACGGIFAGTLQFEEEELAALL